MRPRPSHIILILALAVTLAAAACQTQRSVLIHADGQTRLVTVQHAETVGDALAEAGISLGERDRVTPGIYDRLARSGAITRGPRHRAHRIRDGIRALPARDHPRRGHAPRRDPTPAGGSAGRAAAHLPHHPGGRRRRQPQADRPGGDAAAGDRGPARGHHGQPAGRAGHGDPGLPVRRQRLGHPRQQRRQAARSPSTGTWTAGSLPSPPTATSWPLRAARPRAPAG